MGFLPSVASNSCTPCGSGFLCVIFPDPQCMSLEANCVDAKGYITDNLLRLLDLMRLREMHSICKSYVHSTFLEMFAVMSFNLRFL